jgi:hypothetical protein
MEKFWRVAYLAAVNAAAESVAAEDSGRDGGF